MSSDQPTQENETNELVYTNYGISVSMDINENTSDFDIMNVMLAAMIIASGPFDTDDDSSDSPEEGICYIEKKIGDSVTLCDYYNVNIRDRKVVLKNVPTTHWKVEFDDYKIKLIGDATIVLDERGVRVNKISYSYKVPDEDNEIDWEEFLEAIRNIHSSMFDHLLLKGSDKVASDETDMLCQICYTNASNVKLSNCTHSDLCIGCSNKLIKTNNPRCPYCRTPITTQPIRYRNFDQY